MLARVLSQAKHTDFRLQFILIQETHSTTQSCKNTQSDKCICYIAETCGNQYYRRLTEIEIVNGRSLRERSVPVDSIKRFLLGLSDGVTVEHLTSDRFAAVV